MPTTFAVALEGCRKPSGAAGRAHALSPSSAPDARTGGCFGAARLPRAPSRQLEINQSSSHSCPAHKRAGRPANRSSNRAKLLCRRDLPLTLSPVPTLSPGNGFIEGRELDHFLREFVASVSANNLSADVSIILEAESTSIDSSLR